MLSIRNFVRMLVCLSLLGALGLPSLVQAASPQRLAAAGDILVTEQGYDDIGEVLETQFGWMKTVDWTEISPDDLADYTLLESAKTLFINCSSFIPYELPTDNLRRFVQEGGTLYASDWAYEYIDAAFPGYIEFPSEYAQLGASGTVTATITDAGLRNYLFGVELTSTLSLDYDLPGWVVITRTLRSDVTVLMRGDVVVDDYYGYENPLIPDRPLAVTFPYGEGRVVYTTFHNEAQPNELEKRLLEYLVLLPTTTSLQQQTQQALSDAGFLQVRQDLNLVDPGGEALGTYAVGSERSIAFAVGWGGSTLRLDVYRPNGTLYSQEESSQPPLLISIPKADAVSGLWSYRVTAVDVPSENYPIVVGIGNEATLIYLPMTIR